MTNTLRESIMVAAMEGDLSRLLVLGRDGLGRPLLLGGAVSYTHLTLPTTPYV